MTSDLQAVPWHQPFESAPQRIWDVLIIGAGPAGSTAAIRLSARGYRVLLLDKRHFPREKICGDVLIADALSALHRLGLSECVQQMGHQTCQASLFSPSRIQYPVPGRYITLKRHVLDTLMARRAVEAGAVFCHGKVEKLSAGGDGSIACTLSGSPRVCQGRVAVVATGANVELLRMLGMVTRPRASGVAVRSYIRSSAGIDHLVAVWDRSIVPGYAWIFPMGGQEYNVGCGILYGGNACGHTNLRRMFWKFVTKFALARDLLRQAVAMSPLQGAQLRCGLRGVHPCTESVEGVSCSAGPLTLAVPSPAPHGQGTAPAGKRKKMPLPVLAIGEAIGTTFSATGEGIGKAMETGELAADIIDTALRSGNLARLREFSPLLEARFRSRYLGYEIAERGLAQPWLHDLVARRARRSKFIQEAIAGIIKETVDPRLVYSWRGILGSFW